MFDQVTKRKEQYSNAEGLLQFIEGISRHYFSNIILERRRMLDHNQKYSAAHKWTLSACCDIAINVGLCLSNVDSFHTNKTGCSTNTRSVGSSPWRSSQNLFQYTWLFWRKCWSVISALEFQENVLQVLPLLCLFSSSSWIFCWIR